MPLNNKLGCCFEKKYFVFTVKTTKLIVERGNYLASKRLLLTKELHGFYLGSIYPLTLETYVNGSIETC